jgi:hypothetical protein
VVEGYFIGPSGSGLLRTVFNGRGLPSNFLLYNITVTDVVISEY